MKTTRRTFIKQSTLALSSTAIANSTFAFGKKKPTQLTGIQLYSIKDDMMADPLGTLKQLAAMGYQNVEHANYKERKFYGWSAAELKKILSDLGMTMPSGHTELGKDHWDESKNDFTDLWKYTVEDAATVGQQFVISPWLGDSWRNSESALKKSMDIFNKSGELCKKSGMKFGYHNHHFEFSEKFGDKTMYDVIMENTDQKLVIHQLDIGNLYRGGATALDIVTRFPGRFQSMHVKDEIAVSDETRKFESTVLGNGIVNVKEIIDIGKKSGGTFHFIIEQEAFQGKAPLACAKENLAIMKKWGY